MITHSSNEYFCKYECMQRQCLAIKFSSPGRTCELLTNGTLVLREKVDGFPKGIGNVHTVWFSMDTAERYVQGEVESYAKSI